MLSTTTTLHQYEIPGEPRSAVVHHYSLGAVGELEAEFRAAIRSKPPSAVGVSIKLAPVGPCIQTLALATQDRVFCLSLRHPLSPAQCKALQELFSSIQYLAGFEFPYTNVLLAHTLGSNVAGYDLSTLALLRISKDRNIATPGNFLNSKNPSVFVRRINELWDGDVLRSGANSTGTPDPDYALRAWFTAIAANMAFEDLLSGQKLSTEFIDTPLLQSFVDLTSRAIRLDLFKPRTYENEFSKVQMLPDGRIDVHNARYKTRIRKSTQTHLEIYLENGDRVNAMTKGVKGRRSSARTERPLRGDISHIRVIGHEERTNAEQAQYRFLLLSLTTARITPPFVNILWFPGNAQEVRHDNEEIDISCHQTYHILNNLNDSQRAIVRAMVSSVPRDSLVIAHGPPGTGKTTTIAAAAAIWTFYDVPCWIIAQSNVGVKNIAEKLFKEKVHFKLIVSQEFLVEWHEELYSDIEATLIRSDELPNGPSDVSRMFGDVKVVLCTLGMLSNPQLDNCGLFDVIPVRSLVTDEASQIDVFEFMHLFYKFSNVLTKVCFFGDPKQLPPYGAEEANLDTIFDIKHLKRSAYFLNTQYRLPIPLGKFISEKVYLGKLRSCHKIVDYACISFIDVAKGEETKVGNSYKNMEEVHMVVRIARRYHQRDLSFCVITFYDPQRSAISKALEVANLPTGNVYNVDSFQGNEADYVILSSVRTQHAGFLISQPRMNVALTRCREGMVVVTNRLFLQGAGKNTLLGQLCHTWSQHRTAWIEWKAMLNGSVALPGLLPGPPSDTLQVSRATPEFTSSRTAPVSASTPQRPPAHNTKANEQSHPRPDPHASTPRRNPPSPTTTTMNKIFPPLPSAAHTGPGVPEMRQQQQPGRPGMSQIIPKYDPIAKLGLRRYAAAAAPQGNDAAVFHWRQQQREAPTPTPTTFRTTQWPSLSSSSSADADAKGGGFWRSKARADAEAEGDDGSWRRTAGPLTPSAAEASSSWRRSIHPWQTQTIGSRIS